MNSQYQHGNRVGIEIFGLNGGICKTGIPFPKGKVTSLNQLKLLQNEKPVEGSARPLCFWDDGSIRWIALELFHDIQHSNSYKLEISENIHAQSTPASTQIETVKHKDAEELYLETLRHRFIVNLNNLSLSAISLNDNSTIFSIPLLSGILSKDNQRTIGKISHWKSISSINLMTNMPGSIELSLEGYFDQPSNKEQLRFQTILIFYYTRPYINIRSTIHNPNPAKHPDGHWDLGGKGSEFFNSFTFDIELNASDSLSYQTLANTQWDEAQLPTKIFQLSSGGRNWRSPNHVNEYNEVTLKTNGFELTSGSKKTTFNGRATPTFRSASGTSVTIEKFWQNFPTAIENNGNKITLGLFPLNEDNNYELQGGEKKTHTIWLGLSNQLTNLDWVHSPSIAKADTSWLMQYGALPMLSPFADIDPIAEIIKLGLEHPNNFFAKREAIDEYGWRNFGDLYADHETARHTGKELFASHYNNQYDPVYGFLRQFLVSGDQRWFELASDLAGHVIDIDIYHTEEDKAEYNGGLFWHTDHYLKAFTSTHRTYSRLQGNDAHEDRVGGGGPGGQHCYTTGIALYYLLTGDENYKQAVLTLTKWITHVYEGTGTCLELLHSIKNHHSPGLKNPFTGQYPFDRGTANYIIALLDSYQLTQAPEYLQRAEQIIHNTAHPADDITARGLDNMEEQWFYNVFLQAICRYLQVKESQDAFDDDFYYARDILLHYADWMLEHEHPYLDKPENLEFPNDTWTAQDLRKAHILAAANHYAAPSQPAYLEKARFFQDYVANKLSTSEERTYTRILALLMQNYGALAYYESLPKDTDYSPRRQSWPAAYYQQPQRLAADITKTLVNRLLKLSPTKEIAWLKKRIRS